MIPALDEYPAWDMGRVFWGLYYLSAEGAVCGGKWDAAHQEHENETPHPPRLHPHSDAKLPRGVSLFSESGTHIVVPQKAHWTLPNQARDGEAIRVLSMGRAGLTSYAMGCFKDSISSRML